MTIHIAGILVLLAPFVVMLLMWGKEFGIKDATLALCKFLLIMLWVSIGVSMLLNMTPWGSQVYEDERVVDNVSYPNEQSE